MRKFRPVYGQKRVDALAGTKISFSHFFVKLTYNKIIPI